MKFTLTILCFFISNILLTFPPFENKSANLIETTESIEKADFDINVSQNGNTSGAKVSSQYSFETSVDILLATTDINGKTIDLNLQMLFNSDNNYYGIELKDLNNSEANATKSIVVFDYMTMKMLNLLDKSGSKLGVSKELNNDQLLVWKNNDVEFDQGTSFFSKTGKKKELLGYTCEQYIISSKDGKGECWVSNDKDLKIGLALNAMAHSSKKENYQMPDHYPDGAILEMTFERKEGNKLRWLATAINKNIDLSIHTGEYTILNM